MILCIIDDHQLLGQSLKRLFSKVPNVTDVYYYQNAEGFLAERFTAWQPDVVIADLMLPGMNGIDMIVKIKSTLPATKFIIITSLVDPFMVKEAFREGVVGYLTKEAPEEELLEAVETVRAGGRYINQAMKNKVVEFLFDDDPKEYNLSPREKEVLQKICSGNTPKEIAAQLDLSIHTIQQFIKRIMRKMKVKRTTDLVVLAIKKGLYSPV